MKKLLENMLLFMNIWLHDLTQNFVTEFYGPYSSVLQSTMVIYFLPHSYTHGIMNQLLLELIRLISELKKYHFQLLPYVQTIR